MESAVKGKEKKFAFLISDMYFQALGNPATLISVVKKIENTLISVHGKIAVLNQANFSVLVRGQNCHSAATF